MISKKMDKFLSVCKSCARALRDVVLAYATLLYGKLSKLFSRWFPVVKRKVWEKTYRMTRYLTYGAGIFIKKRAARSAAQFSFFILMTLFPLLICVHWFLSTFLGSLQEDPAKLLESFTDLVPASVLAVFSEYIAYISENNDTRILVAGLFMLVAPSAAAFRALRGILCDIRNKTETNGALMFILSFFISIVMLLIIYISMVLLFTGNRLLRFLVNRFHLSTSILGWNWIRFLLLFVMLYILLYLMYRFAHIDLLEPREVLNGKAYPGALSASTVMVAVSIIYSWFINLSTGYPLVYGSLASLIILMLWLYTCSSVIIFGGILNRIVSEHEALRRRFAVPKDVHSAAEKAHRSLRIAMRSAENSRRKKK